MTNSVGHHQVHCFLESLDRLLFDLNVHNNRTVALLEAIKQMNGNDVVPCAIKKYADNHLGTETGTYDPIQRLQRYVIRLRQAHSNLRAEVQKLQDEDDPINRLCDILEQTIGELGRQQMANSAKSEADAAMRFDQPPAKKRKIERHI